MDRMIEQIGISYSGWVTINSKPGTEALTSTLLLWGSFMKKGSRRQFRKKTMQH